MINLLLRLNPFKRFMLTTVILTGILISTIQILIQNLETLSAHPEKKLTLKHIIQVLPEWQISILVIIILIAAILLSLLHYYELNKLKNTLKNSLTEKNIAPHFEHLYSGNNFNTVNKNIDTLLHLYKNFDTMKSNRIYLEVNTLKILLSYLEEGILFIDKEKIVTHINQVGEQLLKLIPGEIINQSISRKIHNDHMLENIDNSLKEEKKIINKQLNSDDACPLLYSIIPIKDRHTTIIRALIIIKKAPSHHEKPTPPSS